MKRKFRWPAVLNIRALGSLFRPLVERWGSDDLRLPVMGSAALHLILIIGLFVVLPSSVEDRKINPTPRFVSAKVVSIQEKTKPKPVKKAAPKPVPKKRSVTKPATQKMPAARPKPRPDQKAIALKKKQQEEKRRKKLEKQRKEQEKAEREERERLQKQSEQEMLAALAREQEARRQAQAQAQAQADQLTVAGYVDVIGGLVEGQWNRPPSARNGMYVVLRIRLTPTGEVISITRLAGNGNEAFDRSAKQAIDKAAPFREIQGMESRIFEQNFREFRFEFRPEDLLE